MVDKSYRADNAQKRIGNHGSLGGEQNPLATLGWGTVVRAHTKTWHTSQDRRAAHFTNELLIQELEQS